MILGACLTVECLPDIRHVHKLCFVLPGPRYIRCMRKHLYTLRSVMDATGWNPSGSPLHPLHAAAAGSLFFLADTIEAKLTQRGRAVLVCSWLVVRLCVRAVEAAPPGMGSTINSLYEPAVIQEFFLADADVEIRKTDLVR